MFCGEFGRVRFLVVCFLYKPIPTHEKIFAVGKSGGRNATFNLIFLGLGWPWVGEFVGFIMIFICFPTQQNLVNRKHPNLETKALEKVSPGVVYSRRGGILRTGGILRHLRYYTSTSVVYVYTYRFNKPLCRSSSSVVFCFLRSASGLKCKYAREHKVSVFARR